MTNEERRGETKRQHYVPRMILRNFSKDGKRISLVVNGRRIDGANIGRQCYEDYFYGADNIMEKSFAQGEAKMAVFLGDLTPSRFNNLSATEKHDLKMFAAYQLCRTKGAAEHASKFAGAFMKKALQSTVILNKEVDITPGDIESLDIGIHNAQNEAIWNFAKSTPILRDLETKFITTDRTPGFVIADNPVTAYNQFAEHHPNLSICAARTGLALKGLQLFLPLSPSLTLALFDPSTYQYGGNSTLCRAGPKDVLALNRMQAVNAFSCIYFHEDRIDDVTLEGLVDTRKRHPSVYEKNVLTGPMQHRADGQFSQMVLVYNREIRLGSKLSFVRTLDGHAYDGYDEISVPIRSPENFDLASEYGKMLEKMVAEAKANSDAERKKQ